MKKLCWPVVLPKLFSMQCIENVFLGLNRKITKLVPFTVSESNIFRTYNDFYFPLLRKKILCSLERKMTDSCRWFWILQSNLVGFNFFPREKHAFLSRGKNIASFFSFSWHFLIYLVPSHSPTKLPTHSNSSFIS